MREKDELIIEFAETLYLGSQPEYHDNKCPQCRRLKDEMLRLHHDLGKLVNYLKEEREKSANR